MKRIFLLELLVWGKKMTKSSLKNKILFIFEKAISSKILKFVNRPCYYFWSTQQFLQNGVQINFLQINSDNFFSVNYAKKSNFLTIAQKVAAHFVEIVEYVKNNNKGDLRISIFSKIWPFQKWIKFYFFRLLWVMDFFWKTYAVKISFLLCC